MKKSITVRVSEQVASKLEYQATQKGITRQALIEQILISATSTTALPENSKFMSYVSPRILDHIEQELQTITKGSEVGLKQLVGDTLWDELDDTTRRNFGKEFKSMVESGNFRQLTVGRKKSNNEQQYNVNK